MPEVKARLDTLATLERDIRTALDIADRCEEHLIAITLDQTLNCISDRIETLRQTGIL